MTIEAAEDRDLPAVRRLLEEHHLPLAGVDDLVPHMLVAREKSGIVGTAALDVYADGALLRSLAVDGAHQGRRLGQQLTEAALQLARTHGAEEVFLLTTTAEAFFRKIGFETITREEVPALVQTSVEFQSACPRSATVMRKRLAPTSRP